MFPLDFPRRRIRRELTAGRSPVLLDVFCGRGTSLYAARIAGLRSYGIDSSPVAVAITKAKLASTSLRSVLALTEDLLSRTGRVAVPAGEFWRLAYHASTLQQIVRLRDGLLTCRDTEAARMLTAITLGALHGPLAKNPANSGYFSNQMPRTYGCKPGYAVRYWKTRRIKAPSVDVRCVVQRRAVRIFSSPTLPKATNSTVILGDSRNPSIFRAMEPPDLVVTSPPYFGMRTYVEDQWIRNWFLGGPPHVDYGAGSPICGGTAADFALALAAVWNNVGDIGSESLKVAVRFGGIRSRRSDPVNLLTGSFEESRHPWKLVSRRAVRSINPGRRQAEQMRVSGTAVEEFDAGWILG
jgi:hypothetical protein